MRAEILPCYLHFLWSLSGMMYDIKLSVCLSISLSVYYAKPYWQLPKERLIIAV